MANQHATLKINSIVTSKAYTVVADSRPTYSISVTHTNLSEVAGNPTSIKQGSTAALYFTADGEEYKMPDSITVGSTTIMAGTSITVSNVATFLYTKNGTTAGNVYITEPQANISFTVVGETILTQLDTPTNVTADGTTISFDPVDNATIYEVYADGTSIGTYTP